jgi:hypothetical protein
MNSKDFSYSKKRQETDKSVGDWFGERPRGRMQILLSLNK